MEIKREKYLNDLINRKRQIIVEKCCKSSFKKSDLNGQKTIVNFYDCFLVFLNA